MINEENIAGYYIQRSEDAKKYKTIAKIKDKYVTHYTDTNLKPNTTYYYKISTYTKQGIPSFAKLKKITTAPTIEPISYIANSGLKAKGVIKFIFRPHLNERVKGYYVERFNDDSLKWEKIATIEPRLRAEYIDKGLVDGKIYKYRIIAYTFDGLKSPPSKELIIQTVQKPQVVVNINASTDLPKKIVINWKAVKGAKEYNVYYSSDDLSYSLLGTIKNTKYIDNINKNGYKRYYKVTSINKYGIESLKSQSVMGSTLDIPAKPVVSVDKTQKTVTFTIISPDKRAVKYLIVKNNKQHIQKENIYKDKIDPKKSYVYKIYIIDKYGLVSEPKEVEIN